MAEIKIGEPFYAPKTVVAYQLDDITATETFYQGQKIGVVRAIDNGVVTFLESVDDGWGNEKNVEYFVYLLDLDDVVVVPTEKKKTQPKVSVPKKGSSKTTVDDIVDIFKNLPQNLPKNEGTTNNRKTPPFMPPEPEEDKILGLKPAVFYSILSFFGALILVLIFWGFASPKPQPTPQAQPLSGVFDDDSIVIPKSKIVIV
ncbi:MAG: hypothetical protein MUF58_20280 [Arcicella sp.]|jgi:hypothetical protein|nr:hypothetical protein [Arcicella sp.]